METANKAKSKIQSFTDLDAWKEGHKLVLVIYEMTKEFPKEEMFGLAIQIIRAAVSITSNIAEGFSRQSYKDKLHFYSMALGSLTEVQNQLLISRDIKYLSSHNFLEIANQTVKVSKIINGLIKSSKTIIHNS
ncbi:MAG: four helix bundle protein [Patescibacteria group bacterium]|nr:four helix bundle protein [Patescibacteria group bacterium]